MEEDPLFGLFAYGGLLRETDGGIEVIPRDGLRKRFHVIQGERRLHIDGKPAGQISSRGDEWITVDLPISLKDVHNVEIRVM